MLVDQPAQVLARDAGQRLREERDAGDGLRPLRLGRAAGEREAAAQLGDLVRLGAALVEQRPDPLGQLLGPGAQQRRGLGERRLLGGDVGERAGAGQRLDRGGRRWRWRPRRRA